MLTRAIRPCTDESGQAIVEMLLVVLICLIFGIGIFETGAFLHNVSVMNQALNDAAIYASWGAPLSKIKASLLRETDNLLAGAFLAQRVSPKGLIVEIWNPRSEELLAPAPGLSSPFDDHTKLPPHEKNIAEKIFWAQRYEVRVAVLYEIGIQIPFLGPITVSSPIVGSHTIQTSNDMDRDGLVDAREGDYVPYYLDQSGDTEWRHPQHRDGSGELDTVKFADPDGDGQPLGNDDFPYDYDNDGREDKFDPGDNRMSQNPLVGP